MKTADFPEKTTDVVDYLLSNCRCKVKFTTKNVSILASIDVDFVIFKIKGFTIRTKDEKLWVNPPSRPVPPPAKWPQIFWSDYPDFWKRLAEIIMDAYQAEKDKSVAADDMQEVNPDDIPF